MGTTISDRLAFLIDADPKNAVRGFEKTADAARRELGAAEKRIDKIGSSMTRVGGLTLAASVVAGAGLFDLAGAAGESQAAVAANVQILGDASDTAQQWAKTSVESAGISETAALDAATGFAQLGKKIGLTGDDLSDFATGHVEAAADMAAFKDVLPQKAIEDLQSAYAGSAEVLRKYGIFLDDASLKQAYFRETGEQVTGTLTAQQRILATHSEVTRQGAEFQGQWARESDGFIAQQAKFTAEMQNLKAAIGEGVVPVASEMIGALSSAVGVFNDLDPAVQSGVGSLLAYTTAAGGTVGALALVGGQVIKAREQFVSVGDDGTKSLTKLGKAASGVGLAFAGLAAVQVVGAVFDGVTNRIEDTSQAVEDLQAALNRGVDNEALAGYLSTLSNESKHWYDTFSAGGRAGVEIENFQIRVKALSDEVGRLQDNRDLGGLQRMADILKDAYAELPDGSDTAQGALEDGFDADRLALVKLSAETEVAIERQRTLANSTPEVVKAQKELAAAVGNSEAALSAIKDPAAHAASKVDEFGNAISDAGDEVETFADKFSDLLGLLDEEDSLHDLEEGFEDFAESAKEAYTAQEEGAENAAEKARDASRAQNDLIRDVVAWADEVGEIPDDKVTEIVTLIDEGSLAEARAKLDLLAVKRTIQLAISAGKTTTYTGEGYAGPTRAAGGPVYDGNDFLVGERGPEIARFDGPATIYPAGVTPTPAPGATDQAVPLLREIVELLRTTAARPAITVETVVQPSGSDFATEMVRLESGYAGAMS